MQDDVVQKMKEYLENATPEQLAEDYNEIINNHDGPTIKDYFTSLNKYNQLKHDYMIKKYDNNKQLNNNIIKETLKLLLALNICHIFLYPFSFLFSLFGYFIFVLCVSAILSILWYIDNDNIILYKF